MDAFIESNEMPYLGDTTPMNDVASSCKFDEPENEQIEIVEV